MVNYDSALNATFAALADPTRRAMLAHLALAGETPVSALAQPFRMSLPAVSKHVGVLERAGLVARRRDGRVRRCRLVARPMREANAWIARYRRFWEHQLDRLARYLDENHLEEDAAWPPHPKPPRSPSGSRARSPHAGKKSSEPGPTRKR